MSLPEGLILSQSALQDYLDCPRRFELRYIRDIRWPAEQTSSSLDFESHQRKGQDFHHLLHQHAAGVDERSLEATLEAADDELGVWWRNYLGWQAANLPAERYPELVLTMPLAGRLLMAKYDIVARMADSSFLVVDWKTGRKPSRAALSNRMQTLVYPFVLARSGEWLNGGEPIAPDRIRMVYWFAGDGGTVEFESSGESIESTGERLVSIIEEMSERFDYPMTAQEQSCRFCSYRSLCDRGVEPGSFEEYLESVESGGVDGELSVPSLDDLGEIQF